MDNYAAHKRPEVKDWLDADPRVNLHFTPNHASWMNMVEIWFSMAERQAIHRGSYRSVRDLTRAIRTYPFTWTKTAEQILAKANRPESSNTAQQ